MSTILPKIQQPELFFGFVSPIGTDISGTIQQFRAYFEGNDYHVVEINVTNFFIPLSKYIKPEVELDRSTEYKRYDSYIKYGNQLRKSFSDDGILSSLVINRIARQRSRLVESGKISGDYSGVVYLLHQFKRKEEIALLRAVYGRLFFQISLYSRRGARVDHLARKFAKSEHTSGPNKFRDKAESLIQTDESQANAPNGQQVAKIFHDADFIVSLDTNKSLRSQISRFCDLIFGANFISPTKQEYGMFAAKAAALRTLDLSRQVGAAIFTQSMEIIAMGSNEVPKAGGGTYWCDDPYDEREYKNGTDSNDERKKEILVELLREIIPEQDIPAIMAKKTIKDSQFMDALEYGRIVHAEMSAITDSARNGREIRNSILFSTTFPCHMCAKHIISSGVAKVIFLEPYPKSLAYDLHSDSIDIEGGDRGTYASHPSVEFMHFFGVTPRRYRELFERGSRKSNGLFEKYIDGKPSVVMDVKFPFYIPIENQIIITSSRLVDIMDKLAAEEAAT